MYNICLPSPSIRVLNSTPWLGLQVPTHVSLYVYMESAVQRPAAMKETESEPSSPELDFKQKTTTETMKDISCRHIFNSQHGSEANRNFKSGTQFPLIMYYNSPIPPNVTSTSYTFYSSLPHPLSVFSSEPPTLNPHKPALPMKYGEQPHPATSRGNE
ncbi:hypothetical protein BDP55DRAFT_626130 [Colletotrichum godetiae]|uniref:Uncharacterized protein n=1 Tax=Colletotrichum godetiae TaxID=1209918 RepID=A0AAJ0AYC9_9PEZI|nr:uncharacterized protein BDP55DRAFT_626130 [Colletotrichum godetiae]KAK1700566.1 hypothetical protein BDP55DRAFT_626130 [Colletotrichum godetiae]